MTFVPVEQPNQELVDLLLAMKTVAQTWPATQGTMNQILSCKKQLATKERSPP